MNLFSLKDKIIIITGATGVLGSVMAKHLAKEGAVVGILGRTKSKCETLQDEISKSGDKSFILHADVMKADELESCFEALKKDYGQIDCLVNAAGGNVPGSTVMPDQSVFDMDIEDLKKAQDLNLMGTILPTQIFGKMMADQKRGSIINISSMASLTTITRVMGYTIAKTAINGYTKWMAVEMATKLGDGIRVNAIAPGFFITEQNRALLTNPDGSMTERGQKVIDNTPMQRFGEPEELLGALQWLCSEGSSFITGTVIAVDGGFSAYSGV